jgi:hypothetical protein
MRAYLDARPLTLDRPTIAGAIDAARRAAEATGRVIVEVKVDGQLLDGPALADPADDATPAGADHPEVELTSADPVALVAGVFLQAADEIDRIRGVQTDAATAVCQGRLADALGMLSEITATWDQARRAVEDGPGLLLGPHAARFAQACGPKVEAAAAGLSRELAGLKGVLLAQDWPALADTLEGTMADRANEWSSMLRELSAQLTDNL